MMIASRARWMGAYRLRRVLRSAIGWFLAAEKVSGGGEESLQLTEARVSERCTNSPSQHHGDKIERIQPRDSN